MRASSKPTSRRRGQSRNGAALYLAVLSTALITSALGLAALLLVRTERRTTSLGSDLLEARVNARTAVELATRVIANDSSYRTTYSNGVETSPVSLGSDANGTVSWILEDSDGSLADADTELRLRGVGRVGSALQVASVVVTPPQIGPVELRSVTTSTEALQDELTGDNQWCQYLKPTLPAEALRWWVTSVEFYGDKGNGGVDVDVRIYEPLSNNWPSTTVIDEVTVSSSNFENSWTWQSFPFTGTYSLAADEGICLALMTSNANKIPFYLEYVSGLSESDSALIRGAESWTSFEADKALCYRVYGIYTTAAGGVEVVGGTWLWDAAP